MRINRGSLKRLRKLVEKRSKLFQQYEKLGNRITAHSHNGWDAEAVSQLAKEMNGIELRINEIKAEIDDRYDDVPLSVVL